MEESALEKIEKIIKEINTPDLELETGEIDPMVEQELREMGFTDEYFRQRKANILAAKEMSKHPLSSEEKYLQMKRHNANR